MKNLHCRLCLLFTLAILFQFSGLKAQACYELVWSDEFSYSGLSDSTMWTAEVGGNGWGNNELQYYTKNRLENARVEEGNLIIEARKESYEGNSYTSARLITYQNKHSFKYGKIEARMKLPYGQGIWPAFWMLGDDIFKGTSWPACGEIDIMEMIGGGEGKDDVVHGTIHWSDANGNHASYGGEEQLAEGVFADSFHVFSIEWNATSIKWFLDGIQYHSVNITAEHMSEFHEDFFIILNLAIGGNWPGSPDDSTLFPQKMYVDYVRVYQLDTSPGIWGDTVVVAAEKGIRYSSVESEDFTYLWSVPAGVNLVEGQGTNSIVVDWGCEPGTVSCDLTSLCSQYDLSLDVALERINISGKDFVEPDQANLTYSIPLTREATHNWTLPPGVSINSGADSSSINLNWNDATGEIILSLDNYCGSDTAYKPVSIISQVPYPDPEKPHFIPGTIESVLYDTGGEGYAYHDFETENLGTGSRQDEGVDTEPNDGGENIGWLEPGEWLEYTIEVGSTDLYDIEIRLASPNSAGKFKLLFDGIDRTGDVSVPQTGNWTAFTSLSLEDIQLNSTDSRMRIHIVNGQFNMGRMIFTASPGVSTEAINESRPIFIYPTIPEDRIFVKNITSVNPYSIRDVSGRVLKTGTIEPEGFISTEGMQAGLYILILDRTEILNFMIVK